jgi:hypothetical protein
LSLNFRDEQAFSALDVVAIAKKHLDVVSGGSIRASIARENCHFRLQIPYIWYAVLGQIQHAGVLSRIHQGE